MQHNQKVTVGVTVHDLTARTRLRGEGWHHLSVKSLKICHQNNINGRILGGTVVFEFKSPYKLRVPVK